MTTLTLLSPLSGWSLPIEEVPDAVFADRMLGDGVAIDPTSSILHAPCAGELISVAPTAHAVTLRTDIGAELLMHVGIDTVALKGEGFEAQVAAGRRVAAGEPLVRFDLDLIARRAPSLVTPLVVTNGDRYEIVRKLSGQAIAQGEVLLELRATGGTSRGVSPPDAGSAALRLRVSLPHGIHARPAALIARRLRELDARVTVVAHGRRANAASAVGLMSLGVRHDDEIALEATGADARTAIEAIAAFLEESTSQARGAEPSAARPGGVAHSTSAPSPPAAGTVLRGIVASGGVALGVAAPVIRIERSVAESGAGATHETAELTRARDTVRERLRLRAAAAGSQGEIAAAHLEFLDDPDLVAAAAGEIGRGRSAGYAWRSAVRASIAALRDLDDALLGERADDLLDLESQVLAALAGEEGHPALELPEAAIVLADELLPSQLVTLDAARIAGLATARGGATSHVAIIAAAMGKPMLVGLGTALLAVERGTRLLLDAERGVLRVDPPPEEIATVASELDRRRARDAADREAAAMPAVTMDGVRIGVFANVGGAAEAVEAVSRGAEGCGLLRTEFLFLERRSAPDVVAQASEYQKVVDAFGGRPVVIRTLDAGADKPIAYLEQPREENPALGIRGIRLSLRYPDLLATQLEAVLRVRPVASCRVMLPMINDRAEVERVRALLGEIAGRLGVEAPALGVMIETPAAALSAAQICEIADFVSIGTNDLTQYTLAMDRTHPGLAAGLDGLHPAVLRLIASTAEAARSRGRHVAVCGGLASDPLAIPVLLGLGVEELSVVPGLIPRVKALVRALTLADCRVLATRALALASAAEVRAMLRDVDRADRRSPAVPA
jgi:phosphocarrier protein FPr/phosphocarrier protein